MTNPGTAPVMLSVAAFGRLVALECADEAFSRSLAAVWSRCLGRGGDGPPVGTITVDPDRAGPLLLAQLISLALGDTDDDATDRTGRMLPLYGAAVARPDGRVIAMVGASTPLVTDTAVRLAGRGFGFVTGNLIALADGGEVWPFPAPVPASVRADDITGVAGPDQLGLGRCGEELHLSQVVVIDSTEEAPASTPEPLMLSDALVAVASRSSQLAQWPSALQRLADAIASCGGAWHVRCQDADSAARAIADLHDQSPGNSDTWDPGDAFPVGAGMASWALRDGRFRRSPYNDAVEIGDEAVLLVGANPVQLGGIGLTIWQAATEPMTLGGLVDRVVAEHGAHPNAQQLVTEAVDSLRQARVLACTRPQTIEQYTSDIENHHADTIAIGPGTQLLS